MPPMPPMRLLALLLMFGAGVALSPLPSPAPLPFWGAALAGEGGGADGGDDGGADDDDADDADDAEDDADDDDRRPAPAQEAEPASAADEIVVLGLAPAARAAAEARGFRVLGVEALALTGQEALRLAPPPGLAPAAARTEIAALDPAAAVDLNHFYRPEGASLCDGPQCAARAQVHWPALPRGCDPGGTVGMIDTGVNLRHAAFAPGRVAVVPLAPGDLGDPSSAAHGTAVAALLAGRPASRTPGLLPAARLLTADAFHRVGEDERADVFTLVRALDALVAGGALAVNLSLAGPPNAILERAVAAADAAGAVLVAAAGNAGPQAPPAYPAALPQVIAVTAVDARGRVWRRAQRGEHIDLAAPGVEVWTAAAVSGGRPKTGTSFAAPFVTAAAYLLRARGLSPAAVRDALRAGALDLGPPGPDPVHGAGLLDARALCGRSAG